MTTVAAGIRIKEFDFSDYAPALGLATLCVVGGASKGKVNVPTRIANEAELVSAFGNPLTNDYGLQAARQFLTQGSRLIYLRVAHNAATADFAVTGQSGGTPAAKATGQISFVSSTNPSDGDSVTLSKGIPQANLKNDVKTSSGNVPITKSGSNIVVAGMTGGDSGNYAQGTVQFASGAQPADGDTVTISDGTLSVIFEFDSNSSVGGGHIAVTIGADAYATMANLITAINGNAFAITATNPKVRVTFEFDNNGTVTPGNVGVAIGASAAATMNNLISAISAQTALGYTAVLDGVAVVPTADLTNKNAGVVGNAVVYKTGSNINVVGMTGGTDAVAGSTVTLVTFLAATPGSWGNDIQVTIAPTTALGAPSENFDLTVLYPVDASGTLAKVEVYTNLSLDSSDARFVDVVLAKGIRGEFRPSAYVTSDTVVDGTPNPGTYTLGASPGTVGDDGVSGLTASDYIGTVSGQVPTGFKAIANAETTEYNILAVPGVSHKDVITAAITLAETRGDFIFLVDPPFGLSVSDVVDWHNGLATGIQDAPTSPLTSNYAALYWGWVQVFDPYNKVDIWLPPSGFVAAVYAYTDNNGGPWLAPAGFVRGHIIGDKVEYSPSDDERAVLNAGQNRVNPIADIISDGLTVFGNRTLQRKPTALDSVHVRRMLLHAEKLCATAVKYLLFEPNDPITWDRFVTLVNPILATIKAGRGLEDFKVICNASTNPPELRAQKRMGAKLLLKAIDAAEIIEINFSLFSSGADFNTAA